MIQFNKKFNLNSFQDEGKFAGYASVYDCFDLHKDIVAKGAFSSSLKEKELWPKMLWQHDPTSPIGRWEKVEERENGLYVEGRLFLDLPKAREAFILLKEGVVNALSIGFQIEKSRRLSEGRLLEKVKLYEISLVTFPANPEARILDIKRTDKYAQLLGQLEQLREKITQSLP
jgi:HK97 family phage prohead protease